MRLASWWHCFGSALLAVHPAMAADAATDQERTTAVVHPDGRAEIANRFLARTFVTRPHLTTESITNRLTGRRIPANGEEFVLDLGQGRSVAASSFRLAETRADPAAGTLCFDLAHGPTGIKAAVTYELKPDWFFLRKRLVLQTGDVYVRSVEVERLKLEDAALAPLLPDCLNVTPVEPPPSIPQQMPRPSIWDIGLGQPVFAADELFFGLEHPAGHNAYEKDGTIFLRHYPGRSGRIECKSAVLGVAANRPRQRTRDAFLSYIERLRQRPVKRFTEFFFDAHLFDEQTRRIVDTAREVFVRRGVKLDCVTINGWAEPREGIMEPVKECPEFLRLLTDYTRRQLGCPLGLHVYTTGRRSPLLRDWIREHFDMVYVQPGPEGRGAYCLADPRAESLLTANLGRYVREHGVCMYYYDWGCFACPAGNHRGHMPGYGTEAIADAFLRHLGAMRAAMPDIFLCDTGWFSPWWLGPYDAVFFTGVGDWNYHLNGPPSFATVDLLGSWRDSVMKKRLEARPYYPATGYINHGAISHDWIHWTRRAPQPRRAFIDYVAMMFLLGPQIAEYILTLPELSEANRDDLAAVHRWGLARDRWLLADTRPVGGDPMKGEPYGFCHIGPANCGVIGLRNPTVFDRAVKLTCDETLGFRPSPRPFAVLATYPFTQPGPKLLRYGDALEVNLAGHELRVLEVAEPSDLPRPVALGCREEPLECDGRRTRIALLGGCGQTVKLVSPTPIEEVLLDGQQWAIEPGVCEAEIRLSGQPRPAPEGRFGPAEIRAAADGLRIAMPAHVPEKVQADLILVFTASALRMPKLSATATFAGKDLDVESPHLHLRDSEGRTRGTHAAASDWSLFRIPLPAGQDTVQCTIRRAAPAEGAIRTRWQGQLQVFVDLRRELSVAHRLEIRHGPAPSKPLPPLPGHWNRLEQSRIEVLAKPVEIAAANRRPNILLAISDDQSWKHAGAYGCPGLNTPAFDRVAREGVLFSQAFSAGPMCTVSRAALLSGRNIWQNREAGTHWSVFPRDLAVYPMLLEQAGYAIGVTGKGWGPGEWRQTGWPHNPAGPQFNDIKCEVPATGIHNTDYAANFAEFLRQKDPQKPFCFWYGGSEPHGPVEKGAGVRLGKDPKEVVLPPFLEDTPENRSNLLDIFVETEWFDRHLGRMLEILHQRGELDNTLVVVTGDNGSAIPHAKGNLYEWGVHVPLAVRWPGRVPAGRTVDDLVSFIDLAPTFLEAAGLKPHPDFTGRSLLGILTSTQAGHVDPSRRFVLLGHERGTHERYDNLGYPMRAIRTDRWRYVMNLKPDRWPSGDPIMRAKGGAPSESELPPDWRKRPAEELFDIRADQGCLRNLAPEAAHESVRKELRGLLEGELTRQGDPRFHGCGDIFESYPRFGQMRPQLGGFAERGKYNPKYQVRPGPAK